VTTRFLVIGGQRCGTTFLHRVLERHPDVAMARPATPEPKVFLSEELTARGLRWYDETYFAHATSESARGEKSTSYLESASAASRAARVLGRATVVAVLRDPVARAVSNWRFSTDHGRERRPLVDALRASLAGEDPWDGTGPATSPFAYLQRGRYAELLEPWRRAFPDRLRLFSFDDVVSGAAVGDVYRAVGVDPALAPEAPGTRVNASDMPALDLPPDLERELRDYFRPSDDALTALLGGPPAWVRAYDEARLS
jgi:hypothetical protein